jgi:copper homeostasis protein
MILEVVLETVQELNAVSSFPVKRIELCSALEVGGLTPSLRLAEAAVRNSEKEIHVMLRTRAGNFDYSPNEINIMLRDLEDFAKIGVKGVVFGFLNGHNVNNTESKKLIDVANFYGLETTFHRAIDSCQNFEGAVQELIQLGCNRILTSAGFSNVTEGKEAIVKLEKTFGSKIQIMPGGGVNTENARYFYENGIKNIHFNIKKPAFGTTSAFGNSFQIDVEKLTEICKLK